MISGRGPYDPVTQQDDTLLTYPYVVVRVDCQVCKKLRRYRLARLVDNFGMEISMPYLLDRLTVNCPWRNDERVFRRGQKRSSSDAPCGAYFRDLQQERPAPDLPADMQPPAKEPTL